MTGRSCRTAAEGAPSGGARRIAGLVLLVLLPGCGALPTPGSGDPTAIQPAPARTTTASDGAPSTSATRPSTTGPSTAVRSSTTRAPRCIGDDGRSTSEVPRRLSLVDVRGRAWAFEPLDGSRPPVVEGAVPAYPAWSTSKVLVVAAYLDTVVGGMPQRIGAHDRRAIEAALTRSDEDAVRAVRDRIPGRPGLAMTRVLRSVGDRSTVAPDSYQGTMRWSLREQVRFVQALASGRVVSAPASRYLLQSMHPVRAHSWGLGTIGATAFKGGWLRQSTPTRQLGVVDGYAVAISTDRGPAVVQSDGDSAHVEQMDRLAALLRERLEWEDHCGRSSVRNGTGRSR